MRFERYRETLAAGIEVVEATYADRLLVAIAHVAECQHMMHGTWQTVKNAEQVFGKDSEEYRLWKEKSKEDNIAFRKAWGNLKALAREASTPLPM